jgi:SAM-dependent methyltransferase
VNGVGGEVAIKVLPEHLADDADALARFEREAKAVATLSQAASTTTQQDGTVRHTASGKQDGTVGNWHGDHRAGPLEHPRMTARESDIRLFQKRFESRSQAERYRDRYKTGRRARMDRMERAALRQLLHGIDGVEVALDLPSGTGRLSPVVAEFAKRIILADSSEDMLAVARDDLPDLPAEYLQTDAQEIRLADRSVDLVFSHRFLNHIYDPAERARILGELARVSRRYLALSYYAPSIRWRWRRLIKRLLGQGQTCDRVPTARHFLVETSAAGLRPLRRTMLRRFPLTAAFFLFERA